jgi:hypothetical protein
MNSSWPRLLLGSIRCCDQLPNMRFGFMARPAVNMRAEVESFERKASSKLLNMQFYLLSTRRRVPVALRSTRVVSGNG